MMKQIKTILLLGAVMLSAQLSAQYLTGSGSIVTQSIDLPSIDGIGLGIAATVYVQPGSQQKVEIKAQQNIIDNIKQKVRGGTWSIEFKQKTKGHKDIKIYVTLPKLEQLSIGGSGSIIGKGRFQVDHDLSLSIGGSGNIEVEATAKKINCSIGGSGKAVLGGEAKKLAISIGGSGDVEAYDLRVSHCAVSSAGSGDVEVNVSDELEVSMVGSGDVKYKGSPKVHSSVIGSGDVEKAD